MRYLRFVLLAFSTGASILGQQLGSPGHTEGATTLNESTNLPIAKIGIDDLVGVTVYDAPELTRTVRVGSEGDIRLPMLRQRIRAVGLYPAELEIAITQALTDENVLVNPIVTISVVEYRSRPISVSGAVKKPVTFQATGTVTLLDAISQAEGLADNAGPEVLVSRQSSSAINKAAILTQRISVHGLISGEDPDLNLRLEGGEEIRIPEAGRIFVVGKVKKPGAFLITDGSESSVLKALALSEGLESFAGNRAFIYRTESDGGGKSEIPIELKRIMGRKSPDVPLLANDILYIPDATGKKATLKALETSLMVGTGLSSALIIYENR